MRVDGEDDIAKLATSFNSMASSLQKQIRQLEDLLEGAAPVRVRRLARAAHPADHRAHGRRRAARVPRGLRPAVSRSAELLEPARPLRGLLTDLLEISRFDAGAAVLSSAVDVRNIARRAVATAEPLAERKGSALVMPAARHPVPRGG